MGDGPVLRDRRRPHAAARPAHRDDGGDVLRARGRGVRQATLERLKTDTRHRVEYSHS